MPSTSNFGWTTPADTDLVKDGAAAIRTLGNNIDASLVDLKGGTAGQVLSKATNADMDFTWTNGGDITEVTAGTGLSGGGTSGAVTLTNTVATAFDAKGDLVAGTGADTFAKLTVGANNTVLTADSSTSTGLKWAAPSSDWTLVSTTTGNSGSAINVNVSGYNTLRIHYSYNQNAQGVVRFRVNNLSASNYQYYVYTVTSYANQNNVSGIDLDPFSSAIGTSGIIWIYNANNSGIVKFNIANEAGDGFVNRFDGIYNDNISISSIDFVDASGNFTDFAVRVWGQ